LGRLKPKLKLFFFLFATLPFFFAGCALRSPTPAPRRPGGIYHVVKSGENLFRIGKAYDLPYQELARLNRIDDPHQIRVGQRIFIPGATRQLPVEIITPAQASLEPPRAPDSAERGREGFIWPVRGKITSKFGPRSETFHDGIDIQAPEGSPIRAIETGEVIYSDKLRGYGNIVIIRHSGGFVSVYAHNQSNLVREGQRVVRGEVVGEVGSTGRVSAPHLHFEIRKDNVARDPLHYLPAS
jgi:murein DD-endopeptidase MepM/ murein hydrolase activator NlpD